MDESHGPAVRPREAPWYDGSVFDTHAIARALTAGKLTSEQVNTIVDAVRQATEHGQRATSGMLRGDLTRRVVAVGTTVRKLSRALPGPETIQETVGQARGRMFNVSTRCVAVEKLRESLKEHETLRKQVEQTSVKLFEQRQRVVAKVIGPVEKYVNGLANTPKEFDKSVRAFRIEINRFDSTVQRIRTEAARAEKIGSGVGLAGATAGIGLAALGPSATLAVATTFGTASTGAAISALSGAAATNAALAWVGGGALAAGGGGMATGHAVLALTGPVGWTVGGLALVGSGTYLHYRNGVLAQKAVQERVRVEGEIRSLRTAHREIEGLGASTRTYTEGTLASLVWLCDYAPHDYRQFDLEQKERLAALINHIHSLSELIRKEVAL